EWVPRRFLYLIWREPYMIAAHDTYISAMLSGAGLINAAATDGDRYPKVSVEDMRNAKPDVLFLSSEPYPFRRRDAERLRSEWPEAPEMLHIDGQLLSWFGTMTATAATDLRHWVEGDAEQKLVSHF